MRSIRKRLSGMIVIALILIMVAGMTAHAEVFPSNIGVLSFTDMYGTSAAPITKPRAEYKFYLGVSYNYTCSVSVKSKPGKVVKLAVFDEVMDSLPVHGFAMKPNKVGTTRITATLTDSSGLKKTATKTIRTYKWSNPFKKLKIGSKSFKNTFKNTFERTIAPISGKLSIKMNSQYKKLKVYYIANGSGTMQKISSKAIVDLKSGDKLVFRYNDNKHRVTNEEAIFYIQ